MIGNTEENEEVHEHTDACGTGCTGKHDPVTDTETKQEIKIEKKTVELPNAPASPPSPLTMKEIKALKKSKYAEKKDNFDQAFIIRNRRTGQIVELNALNSFQAAGFIGWRSRHVETLEVKDLNEENNIEESEILRGSSNNSEVMGNETQGSHDAKVEE